MSITQLDAFVYNLTIIHLEDTYGVNTNGLLESLVSLAVIGDFVGKAKNFSFSSTEFSNLSPRISGAAWFGCAVVSITHT